MNRHLGVRPITLIGFSLGARVIFYALVELAKQKAFGIVQDVFLLGTTVSASPRMWYELRSVVSGRFVNAYARNDWVLNYLFRATSGGVGTVAGLRPVSGIPGLENIDVTDKIAGHMSYRTFMPLILDQLGFPVSADYFDEPVVRIWWLYQDSGHLPLPQEPDFTEERIVETEEDAKKKKNWFSKNKNPPALSGHVSRPPSGLSYGKKQGSRTSSDSTADVDLPPRVQGDDALTSSPATESSTLPGDPSASVTNLPAHAGFDLAAIRKVLGEAKFEEMKVQNSQVPTPIVPPPPSPRSGSAPPLQLGSDAAASSSSLRSSNGKAGPGPRSMSRDNISVRLSAPFNRSMSLDNVNDSRDEVADKYADTPRSTYPRSPQSFHQDTSFVNTPRVSHRPIPFASDAWKPSTEPDSFPPVTSSYGLSSASPFNDYSPASHNSFPSFPPDTGLSFGGVDGSITISADPWQVPGDVGKKTTGFNSNPWT